MRIRWIVTLIMMLMGLSACNLGNNVQPTAETLETPTPEGVPEVEILSPQSGDEFVVDEEILVSVRATDSAGITRVQLLANNQIVKTVSSESLEGDTSFSALLDYTPRSTGTVFLRVVAFRGAEVSEPAEIEVEIRDSQAQVTATSNQAPNVPSIPNDGVCRALVSVGLNFRRGPGTEYERITVLNSGTLAPIVGRVGDNSWWQLIVNNQVGWVSSEYTTEYGNCFNVPLIPTPTPNRTTTPTLTPSFTPTHTATTPPNTGEPDLIVVNIQGDTSIIVPSGISSTTETYKVTIRNTGGASAGQFVTTLNVGSKEIDLGVVSGLAASASREFNVDVVFESGGTFDLEVFVDAEDNVDEVSEVNNKGKISVTVAFE